MIAPPESRLTFDGDATDALHEAVEWGVLGLAAEEIAVAVNYAIEALGGAAGTARSAALSAAKVIADAGGRRIGHEAIQLHGGMGVSDELNVSHYARRLAAIRADLGGADAHRLRFASLQ